MSNIPQNVLVDDEDRINLENMGKWCISKGYCLKTRKKQKTLYMHRVIMNPPADMVIDHINGNPLDNRRCNLRVVTHQQNMWNQPRALGYSWYEKRNKFRASIRLNGKTIHIGYYNTEQEAREAYLSAKEQYHKIGN
jgi:hypothetical protein